MKDLSDADQWHYVRTKSNPADYNSTGILEDRSYELNKGQNVV